MNLGTKQRKDRNIYGKLLPKIILFLFMIWYFTLTNYTSSSTALASVGSNVLVMVDYTTEIATVRPGSGNSTKFYMSKDNGKTWELLDTQPSSTGLMAEVDISVLLKSKEVIVLFKGNKDTNPTEYVLQSQDSSLKVTYQVVNEKGKITWNTAQPVEYRVGTLGQWKDASNAGINTAPYEINGATLYFRMKALPIKRSGKPVTMRVPKRPTAPSVKVDGSKLIITGLKNGITQYRINDEIIWRTYVNPDLKTGYLDLRTLFRQDIPHNVSFQGGLIEFRTGATDKKVASAARVIEVPSQPGVSNIARLDGTTLTILDSDPKRPYEYTVLPVGTNEVDFQKARWSSITAARPVIIKKVSVGDQILVRLKSTTDRDTKQVIPASTYQRLVVETITVSMK